MYHVITRKSDGAVLDCRPETPGIMDVLLNQVIPTQGGTADDYEISAGETPVEAIDPRPPVEIEAARWADIRFERNLRLDQSDWTQMPDSPLSAEARAGWADHRQALRDVPQTYAEPDQVVWPEPPE